MSLPDRKNGALVRALVMNGEVSLAVLDTTALVSEAKKRHALKGTPLTVLGNALTAAAYLSSWLKVESSSLTLSIHGENGSVCVSGDGELYLRGYVGGCEDGLGGGVLSVVRDDGDGIPFAGSVALVSENADENFARYFEESEQLPTGVALYTGESENGLSAGGVFLQPLPGASENSRRSVKKEINACRELLLRGEFSKILKRFGAKALETRYPRFACRCSREKAEAAILSMGKSDAFGLLKQEGNITVHCDYCNTDYVIDEARLLTLFSEKRHE